jgi:CSLREA domain-containing protein
MGRTSAKRVLAVVTALGLAGAGLISAGRASAYFNPTVVLHVNMTADNTTPCTLNGAGTQSVGPCSLRGAILTANTYPTTNQVINLSVAAGTYHLSLGSLDVSSPHNIVQIIGIGTGSTVFDGSGNTAPSSVLRIHTATTIANVKITGGTGNAGNGGRGGGIWVAAALDLSNVVVTRNTACNAYTGSICTGSFAGGGGIYLFDIGHAYAVTLRSVWITYNTAALGGGLDSEAQQATSLTGTETHIDYNVACFHLTNGVCTSGGQGGGVYNNGEAMQLSGGTISYNTAGSPAFNDGDGGGVYNLQDNVQIANTRFIGNVAGHEGGGVQNQASIAITGSTLSNNLAEHLGGALAEEDWDHLTNVLISHNTAGGTFECTTSGVHTTCQSAVGTTVGNCATLYPAATLCSSFNGQGGGIYSDYEYPELTSSRVTANSAVSISGHTLCGGGQGGGIFTLWTLGLTASTVDTNVADCGGGIYNTNGSAEAVHSKIIANHALERGGGIWTSVLNGVTLDAALVTSNTANVQTGGIWDAHTGDVVLGNGTSVTGNVSPGSCKNLLLPCT